MNAGFTHTALLLALADAALKSAALLALAAAASLALRKASAAARHALWVGVLVGVLLLPILSYALPEWRVPWLPQWQGWAPAAPVSPTVETHGLAIPLSTIEAAPVPMAGSPLPALSAASARAAPWDAPLAKAQPATATASATAFKLSLPLVSMVWLIGLCLALVPLLLGWWQAARVTRRGRLLGDAEWAALLAETTQALDLRRKVGLHATPGAVMPFTWGAWRPVVIFPETVEKWTPTRRRLVLLHELGHVKRHDWATQTLGALACALYWFNPLAWLAVRQLRLEREQACDDLVLRCGQPPRDYAHELLDIAAASARHRMLNWVAVPMARQSKLEVRLRAILDGTRNRRTLTRAMVLGLLALLAVVVIPMAMLHGAEAEKPVPANASPSSGAGLPAATATTGTDAAVPNLMVGQPEDLVNAQIIWTPHMSRDEAMRAMTDAILRLNGNNTQPPASAGVAVTTPSTNVSAANAPIAFTTASPKIPGTLHFSSAPMNVSAGQANLPAMPSVTLQPLPQLGNATHPIRDARDLFAPQSQVAGASASSQALRGLFSGGSAGTLVLHGTNHYTGPSPTPDKLGRRIRTDALILEMPVDFKLDLTTTPTFDDILALARENPEVRVLQKVDEALWEGVDDEIKLTGVKPPASSNIGWDMRMKLRATTQPDGIKYTYVISSAPDPQHPSGNSWDKASGGTTPEGTPVILEIAFSPDGQRRYAAVVTFTPIAGLPSVNERQIGIPNAASTEVAHQMDDTAQPMSKNMPASAAPRKQVRADALIFELPQDFKLDLQARPTFDDLLALARGNRAVRVLQEAYAIMWDGVEDEIKLTGMDPPGAPALPGSGGPGLQMKLFASRQSDGIHYNTTVALVPNPQSRMSQLAAPVEKSAVGIIRDATPTLVEIGPAPGDQRRYAAVVKFTVIKPDALPLSRPSPPVTSQIQVGIQILAAPADFQIPMFPLKNKRDAAMPTSNKAGSVEFDLWQSPQLAFDDGVTAHFEISKQGGVVKGDGAKMSFDSRSSVAWGHSLADAGSLSADIHAQHTAEGMRYGMALKGNVTQNGLKLEFVLTNSEMETKEGEVALYSLGSLADGRQALGIIMVAEAGPDAAARLTDFDKKLQEDIQQYTAEHGGKLSTRPANATGTP